MKNSVHMIGVFDATDEAMKFAHTTTMPSFNALGRLLGQPDLCFVGRVSWGAINSFFTALSLSEAQVIGVSPATNMYEHEHAFRLPQVAYPLVYLGKGALGADVSIVTSAHTILILGSDTEALEGILGCCESYMAPIIIYSHESGESIKRIVSEKYPSMLGRITVASSDTQARQALQASVRKTYNRI